MGQQQILLIVLSVILVGVAVAIGITMFRDNAISSNRDAIMSDLANFASKAQAYRMKPLNMGGGGGSYQPGGEDMPDSALGTLDNENARYVLTVNSADEIEIEATGKVGDTVWIITYTIDDTGDATVVEDQVGSF